jgi:type II restriction/modification system DNA methylase subunit YeeA
MLIQRLKNSRYKPGINPLQSQIDKMDKEIDQLVYQLYGLTEEEIKIVEES